MVALVGKPSHNNNNNNILVSKYLLILKLNRKYMASTQLKQIIFDNTLKQTPLFHMIVNTT